MVSEAVPVIEPRLAVIETSRNRPLLACRGAVADAPSPPDQGQFWLGTRVDYGSRADVMRSRDVFPPTILQPPYFEAIQDCTVRIRRPRGSGSGSGLGPS
ncbi:hypothetical protein B7463_g10153, partial [Scytalidium lignicola]